MANAIQSGLPPLTPAPEKSLKEMQIESMGPFLAALKNQSIGSEMKPGDMMTATAAITNQNAMYRMQEGFKGMETVFSQHLKSQSGNLVGQEVKLNGNFVPLEPTIPESELNTASYVLPQKAASASIDILDAQGQTIRTLQDIPLVRGTHAVKWDGKDAEGAPVPDGKYVFHVNAHTEEGDVILAERGEDIQVGQIHQALINYILPAEASSVLVDIFHPEFGWVNTIDVTKDSMVGENVLNWDGSNSGGVMMPPSEYTFNIRAHSQKSGELMDTKTHARGTVSEVDISGDEILVRIGDKLIPHNQIIGFGKGI